MLYITWMIVPLLIGNVSPRWTSQPSVVKWPSLKTTFGLFEDRPTTLAAAKQAGWTYMDECNGQWLGIRYGLESDPSVVLLFDRAGYIAGVQNVIFESDLPHDFKPSVSERPAYQYGSFYNSPAYFTTAYFVDPKIVCNTGRNEKTFQDQGLGDRLLLQTGPTADHLLSAPLTQAGAVADPIWFEHKCVPAMGQHFLPYIPDNCDYQPFILLYNQGQLNGFVFVHYGQLSGTKWERADEDGVRDTLGKAPNCVYEIVEKPGYSGMHFYFDILPQLVVCPTSPVLNKLGALTQSILAQVPSKGKPFPKIKGPKINDKVCIVGAGAAGLHMAVSLKKRGFKNLVLFEKSGRVGGKNLDITYKGIINQYLVVSLRYFDTFLPLAEEYGSAELTQGNWADIWLEGSNKRATLQEYILGSVVNITGVAPSSAIHRLMEDAKKYDVVHKDMFGSYSGIPQKPTEDVMYRIRGTIQDFLIRENFESLQPIFKLLVTLPGYGSIDEIGALYGLIHVDPSAILYLVDAALDIPRPPAVVYSLTEGFEQVWTGIAEKENFDIRYNTNIQSVVRTSDGVRLGFWKEELESQSSPLNDRAAINCDFLIWAAPASQLARALKQQTVKENSLLSSMHHNLHTTAWVSMKNELRNGVLSGYQSSMDHNPENAVYWDYASSAAQIPGILRREVVEAWNKNNTQPIIKVVGLQGKKSSNELELKQNIVDHYTALNATDIEFLDIVTWKYFPRWSAKFLSTGPHWDIFDMQGQGNMWFAGGSFSFETVYYVLEYNNLLLKQAGL